MIRLPVAALAVAVALVAPLGGLASAQDAAPAVAGAAGARQTTPSPAHKPRVAKEPGRRHSFDLSLSLVVLGPSDLGSRAATLTPNQSGSTTPYTLFDSSARLQASPGFDVRLGYAVTRELAVEGGMTYSRPGVSLTIGGDAENAEGFTSNAEHLSQYSFDATVRIRLKPLAFHSGRGRPFVAAGAGYLRQLHEGATVVDTGVLYHFGAGLIYILQSRPIRLLPGLTMQGMGLRADVRANVAAGGFSLDDRNRIFAGASGGVYVGF